MSRTPTLWLVAALLGGGVACDRYTPQLPARVFGNEPGSAHALLGCAACHQSTPPDAILLTCTVPSAWDGGCLGCHACDRDRLHPQGAAHGNGLSCADGGCHSSSDLTWADVRGLAPSDTAEVTQPGPCAGACHGNARADDAPLDDSHAAHLDDSPLWNASGSCSTCHPIGGFSAATHNDGVVDLPFGGLALDPDGLVEASYDAGTCTVYCHGATLPEGGAVPPWEGGEAHGACGSCHGLPPAPPHSTSAACSLCHPTGGEHQQISNPNTHIDGVLP